MSNQGDFVNLIRPVKIITDFPVGAMLCHRPKVRANTEVRPYMQFDVAETFRFTQWKLVTDAWSVTPKMFVTDTLCVTNEGRGDAPPSP